MSSLGLVSLEDSIWTGIAVCLLQMAFPLEGQPQTPSPGNSLPFLVSLAYIFLLTNSAQSVFWDDYILFSGWQFITLKFQLTMLLTNSRITNM